MGYLCNCCHKGPSYWKEKSLVELTYLNRQIDSTQPLAKGLASQGDFYLLLKIDILKFSDKVVFICLVISLTAHFPYSSF
jgi:hypothetical protein